MTRKEREAERRARESRRYNDSVPSCIDCGAECTGQRCYGCSQNYLEDNGYPKDDNQAKEGQQGV